jgi:DNA-directed RNA polymerase III subunit RPC6
MMRQQGLQDADLEKELVGVSVTDRVIAINGLLTKRRMELFQLGDKLVYKEVKEENVIKLKGCTQEDLLVYQLIKNASTTGIWTKDLRNKSNLSQVQMSKVLKALEMRKLIKAVKSVASKNRKVYMLFELEPSKELTGGAWYTEQEFDAEFIQVLREHCLKFVMHKGRVTLEELCDFVSCTGMSKVELRPDDVLQVVSTFSAPIELVGFFSTSKGRCS